MHVFFPLYCSLCPSFVTEGEKSRQCFTNHSKITDNGRVSQVVEEKRVGSSLIPVYFLLAFLQPLSRPPIPSHQVPPYRAVSARFRPSTFSQSTPIGLDRVGRRKLHRVLSGKSRAGHGARILNLWETRVWECQ